METERLILLLILVLIVFSMYGHHAMRYGRKINRGRYMRNGDKNVEIKGKSAKILPTTETVNKTVQPSQVGTPAPEVEKPIETPVEESFNVRKYKPYSRPYVFGKNISGFASYGKISSNPITNNLAVAKSSATSPLQKVAQDDALVQASINRVDATNVIDPKIPSLSLMQPKQNVDLTLPEVMVTSRNITPIVSEGYKNRTPLQMREGYNMPVSHKANRIQH